jgi:membrane protein implicated in regulation of membrane protease activity
MESSASGGGLTLLGAIWIVVVLVVIALLVLMIYWRFRRPVPRVHRGLTRRHRQIQEAAAADVADLRESGKKTSPDAPGDWPDEL